MIENELELEIVCNDCGRHFKEFGDLMVFHIPEQMVRDLKIPQKPHLKCPYCRGNQFTIVVLKDAYGTYPDGCKGLDEKPRKNLLVLFDMDCTLIDATSITVEAFYRAFDERFNAHVTMTDVEYAGMPLLTIIANLIKKIGRNPTKEEVLETYFTIVKHEKTLTKTKSVRVLKGVRELLEDLSCLPNVSIGLLTGNSPEIADLLLTTTRLIGFFNRSLWSLGSEWKTRAEGVLLAKQRCERKLEARVDRIVVVGDSAAEITAVKQARRETDTPLFVASVATGNFSKKQLEELGADVVFDSFAAHFEKAKAIINLAGKNARTGESNEEKT